MPTENVLFWQSYVDDKIGPDGKPLCSAIVALLVDDPDVFSDMHRLPPTSFGISTSVIQLSCCCFPLTGPTS